MKKHLLNVLIGFLLGVALVYFTSCRTIQRSRTVADSSSTRTEASAERWVREIVTEYVPTSGGLSMPTIAPLPWNALQFVASVATPGVATPVQVPVAGPERTRIIRQVIREAGEKQAVKAEEKTAAVTEKVTERGWSPIQERALLLVAWALLIGAIGLVLLAVARLVKRN